MKPYNKTNTNSLDILSSNTVIWEGPDIACLDLCHGDTISTVTAKIAEKLCATIESIDDLKTLDLGCIIAKFNYTGVLLNPDNFSLKLLFQLLLDNDCKLQDLLNNLVSSSSSNSINLSGLQLKCITNEILNLCGQIPDNLEINKLAQAIINILCDLQDDVADILIRLITIESRIEALGDPGSGGYTEPSITSCLSTTPTLMSVHIPTITDKAICDLQELVGSPSTIQTTISSQCLSDYVGNSEINFSANSLADTIKNKEIIICDLIGRITNIENTCCSANCADIRIGFSQSFSANTYHLDFTYGAGTDIPLAFVDCGSTFILTDWKGTIKTINNTSGTLTNGSNFQIPLSGTGLDSSQPINLQIKTCFTNLNSGLICKDCFGGTLDVASSAITNSCWDFVIPKTDVLGCGNKNLNYYSLVSSTGVVPLVSFNTSIGGNLSLPNANSNPTVTNMVACSNKIVLTLKNQSINYAPEIKLLITNTSPALYISVVGTLNNTCGC